MPRKKGSASGLHPKCKKTKTKIVKMMEQETWLTDKGAEVDGFIDGVYE